MIFRWWNPHFTYSAESSIIKIIPQRQPGAKARASSPDIPKGHEKCIRFSRPLPFKFLALTDKGSRWIGALSLAQPLYHDAVAAKGTRPNRLITIGSHDNINKIYFHASSKASRLLKNSVIRLETASDFAGAPSRFDVRGKISSETCEMPNPSGGQDICN